MNTDHTNISLDAVPGPHRGQPVLIEGKPLQQARAAMIMLHGRGASAEDILTLTREIKREGFVFLAPQARDYAWYPNSFLAPLASNEPWLSSALAVIETLLAQVRMAGIPATKTILLGFSQGACLSAEFAARHAQRYGGIVVLSGSLIGPDITERNYTGNFASTPIFLGCSDADFYIPKERVLTSAEVLQRLGATVTARLYPNMGHTVNRDELQTITQMTQSVLTSTQ